MPRTLFNLAAHHRFIQQHSDRVLFSKGFFCPCGNSTDSARAKVTCSLCEGIGLTYDAPVEIIGMVTGIHHEKALLESGVAVPGDMVFSPSPFERVVLSDWDKIELTWDDGHPYQGQLVERGIDSANDTLHYTPKLVSRCFSVDPNTEAITLYTEGTDFTIAGRTLTWINADNQPAAEGIYSISYSAQVEWFVFIPPVIRYENAISLGQKVLLRARNVALAGRA